MHIKYFGYVVTRAFILYDNSFVKVGRYHIEEINGNVNNIQHLVCMVINISIERLIECSFFFVRRQQPSYQLPFWDILIWKLMSQFWVDGGLGRFGESVLKETSSYSYSFKKICIL